MHSRNRVTDIENELMVIRGGVGWEELGDWDSHTHTHTHTHIILVLCIKEITIENLLYSIGNFMGNTKKRGFMYKYS